MQEGLRNQTHFYIVMKARNGPSRPSQNPWANGEPPHLVNGTWDQALDVLPVPEYLRKGGAEGRCSLHCGETDLPNVVAVLEPKDVSHLVGRDTLLNAEDLAVEIWH